MENQVAGINIADYVAKKEKRLLTIGRLGDAYAIVVKAFDPETGAEKQPKQQMIFRH